MKGLGTYCVLNRHRIVDDLGADGGVRGRLEHLKSEE